MPDRVKDYDCIIVGSGIAGLYTALHAQELGRALILTKGSIDECNTKYAQGGIAAPIGPGDSVELHMQDTLAVGAGLCDVEAVRILTQEAPDRIADLIHFGVPFDTVNGEVALTREAAHSVPRILHAGGDATGEHIEVTLSRLVQATSVKVQEYCLAAEIRVEDGRVQGVTYLDTRSGIYEEVGCHTLILATGGAGRLFKYNTNPEIATGDGVDLAYQAGAEVTDMEFFQFHPTALRLPGVAPFLISEAVRGEGGILRNSRGEAFMKNYSHQGDLAPRDVVARAIVTEMKGTGVDHVFLDVTHLSGRAVAARFPHIYRFCREHGIDLSTTPIPVAPAAHYMIGGVKTNVWGETNIPGLFACGETACTGVHGANRLASNSLLEVLVFSKRIVQKAKEGGSRGATPLKKREVYPLPRRRYSRKELPFLGTTVFQSLLWDKVGITRWREGLEVAAAILATWEKIAGRPMDRRSYELRNMVLMGRLMAEAALLRQESRGTHFRSDFPEPSPAWQRHITFRKDRRDTLR